MEGRKFLDYTVFEDGTVKNSKGRALSHRVKQDRVEVRLTTPTGVKQYGVARLVYFLFIEEFNLDSKNICVCPIDGNKLNVHRDNLKLMNRKDLIHGEKHVNKAVLKDVEADYIKLMHQKTISKNQHDKTGMSYKDLADLFGTSKNNIRCIIKGLSRNPKKYKLR